MEEMERDVDVEIEPEIESDIVINYPSWIIVSSKGKLTINEVEFCKMFLQSRDLNVSAVSFGICRAKSAKMKSSTKSVKSSPSIL